RGASAITGGQGSAVCETSVAAYSGEARRALRQPLAGERLDAGNVGVDPLAHAFALVVGDWRLGRGDHGAEEEADDLPDGDGDDLVALVPLRPVDGLAEAAFELVQIVLEELRHVGRL